MKSTGVLHGEISALVAELGHGDEVVIADYGLPIPEGVRCIDLAVTTGVPDFLTVLRTVLSELCVERETLATELMTDEHFLLQVVETLPHEPVFLPHEALKQRCSDVKAIIRTGEWTPYANVILRAGVPF